MTILNPFDLPPGTETIFVFPFMRPHDAMGRPTHFSAINLDGTKYFDAKIVVKGRKGEKDEWDEIMDAEQSDLIHYKTGNGVMMRDYASNVRAEFRDWLDTFEGWRLWTDDAYAKGVMFWHMGMMGYNVRDLSTLAAIIGVDWTAHWRDALHYQRQRSNTLEPGHYAEVGRTAIKRLIKQWL